MQPVQGEQSSRPRKQGQSRARALSGAKRRPKQPSQGAASISKPKDWKRQPRRSGRRHCNASLRPEVPTMLTANPSKAKKAPTIASHTSLHHALQLRCMRTLVGLHAQCLKAAASSSTAATVGNRSDQVCLRSRFGKPTDSRRKDLSQAAQLPSRHRIRHLVFEAHLWSGALDLARARPLQPAFAG